MPALHELGNLAEAFAPHTPGQTGLEGVLHHIHRGRIINPGAFLHGQVVIHQKLAQMVFQIALELGPLLGVYIYLLHAVLVQALQMGFAEGFVRMGV